MAFNIYGLSTSNSASTSSSSVNFPVPASSLSILPSVGSVSKYYVESNKTRLQTANEILACAKSNETPNLFVIGGPKYLQLLKASNNEISVEYDLVSQNSGTRNNQHGLIADAKFGYQQYGRNIAVSTLSGSIHIYNLDRGNRIRTTFSDHQRAVNSIDFSALSPHTLLSGSQDGKMKVWDLRLKNTKAQITIIGNADAIRCVQFSPRSGRQFCNISDSGVIQKWDIRKPTTFERKLNAHTGPGLTLDWHPELDYVVSGGRDKQVQVWNMASGTDHLRDPDHVINTSGAVSKVSWCRGRGNGSILTTDIAACYLSDDPTIQILSLGRKYVPKNVIEFHSNQVTGLFWKSPKYLVSCSKDKSVVQHDVTLEPRVIDTLPTVAADWDHRAGSRLLFVKQERHQFEDTREAEVVLPPETYSPNPSSPNLMAKPRPSLPRQLSQPNTRVSPYALLADVPVAENETEVFEFLSANYIMEVPDGMDLLHVCEYNASVAAGAGRYRTCQVWRTLQASVAWDESNKVLNGFQAFHLDNHRDPVPTDPSRSSMNTSDRLSTSVDSYDARSKTYLEENENAIDDEEEDVADARPLQPIEINKNPVVQHHSTFSFTGSSADFDNEKLNMSGSPHTKFRSKSLAMSQIPVSLSSSPAKSRRQSMKETTEPKSIEAPWNPVELLRRSANYSCIQGDVVMCATLALLFAPKYPDAFTETECQDWILTYHEMLQRRCLFESSAHVLRIASKSYELFTKIGQTQTSLRLFCQHCNQPILNEVSKNMWLQDPEIEFGFWYCDRCGKAQGGCVYCNEPVKGTCVVLERCGHKGHFGCLKSWFVESMEECCPGCGKQCV
ncbi:hypothetical protein OGAPHI_006460 [Ogataea philodendri]|uniref:Restriction of telomere capping protein 1 n=1 Tax=Ogataea philodendri TaxID=1378263 RepID=A0A9P8NY52_9ASCO|nr:uncharacterized protein OGAPHI_006460 [Ogataea philodendri]KAH3661612.1 hypothetical protein OGAPHI_006460 [Ogataea philodendri]